MQLATQLPVILVCIAGCVLAMTNLNRAPRAATFALIGLTLYLILSVVFTLLPMTIVQKAHSAGWASQKIGQMMSVIAVVGSILRATALGLMIAAIFAGRSSGPVDKYRRQA